MVQEAMVDIDGSRGEGGGQILRSALTLALLTGKPVRLTNIRARRPQPGLRPQHLQAVQAATVIGDAEVAGATLGSSSLRFQPRTRRPGTWRFAIGTAGSTSLVLQTILLPLSHATQGSRITITGGTHVPWSPCHHYLARHWLPYMQQIGYDISLELEGAGFYPQGGGCVHATIRPVTGLTPLCLTERGALQRLSGISAVANLDLEIAQRQRRQALQRLARHGWAPEIDIVRLPSRGKGTMLLLLAEFERSRCCYYGLGARGKPAERVADEAVDQFEAFLATDGAIDQYLADQLLLPLALAPEPSQLRTSEVTSHLVTNTYVIGQFLPTTTIEIHGSPGQPGLVCITPQKNPSSCTR